MDDIASMMANMGGMGGSPEQQAAQKNHADLAAKNAGEVEGGADGKKYKCVAGGTVRTCVAPRTSCTRLAASHETHCLRSSADMSRPARTASRRSSFASPCKRPRPRRTSRSSSRPPRCRSPSMVCRRRTRRAVRGAGERDRRSKAPRPDSHPQLILTRRGAAQRQALRNRPDGRLHVVPRREGLRAAGDARAHGGHEMADPHGTGGVRVDPLCAHGGHERQTPMAPEESECRYPLSHLHLTGEALCRWLFCKLSVGDAVVSVSLHPALPLHPPDASCCCLCAGGRIRGTRPNNGRAAARADPAVSAAAADAPASPP